jgi:hypothetical protein
LKIRVLKAPKARPGVFCFCLVYNEEWFLPHFLDHYRSLGVASFIFYDDRSTDRTRDILLAQDDCMILVPHADDGSPIEDAMSQQTTLINRVPEEFGQGAWSLTVDADEFLILPRQFSTVGEAVRYLERKNFKCALAPMIDFYPSRLSDRFFDPLPPWKGTPWFDRDSAFKPRRKRTDQLQVTGGVRIRLHEMLASRFPQAYLEIYGRHRYRHAKSWKVPLLKTGAGIERPGPHMVSVALPLDVQLGLAHFKFYPELDARIRESLERKAHFLGAIEYRFLRAVLDLLPDEPLICDRSIEYRSPADVEDAGLIFAH